MVSQISIITRVNCNCSKMVSYKKPVNVCPMGSATEIRRDRRIQKPGECAALPFYGLFVFRLFSRYLKWVFLGHLVCKLNVIAFYVSLRAVAWNLTHCHLPCFLLISLSSSYSSLWASDFIWVEFRLQVCVLHLLHCLSPKIIVIKREFISDKRMASALIALPEFNLHSSGSSEIK